MPISDADRKYMEEVAKYFRQTKDEINPEGSIRDTAIHFGINRNKVRKILITTGDITSPITEEAMKLKRQGMSVEAIAARLDVSTATVSTYLPYTDTIKDGLDPTPHTQAVRDYRAFERSRAERQIHKKGDFPMADTSWKDEWKKDVKMSYTETETRPARLTWDDAEEEKKRINREGGAGGAADLADIADLLKRAQQSVAAEEEEFEKLCSAETLSDDQKARLEELKTKNGMYPGALVARRAKDLEAVSGERLPFAPREVRRLHLELVDHFSDEELEVMKKHGGLKYGEHITRDVIVPSDIPLYAIHYLIQRLFGWQNSHLHKFELPEDKLVSMTENKVDIWSQLVGIIFRSPFMRDEDIFWADDYESGSFKNWMTKKYTGPYLSQCHGEGFIACQGDMGQIFEEQLEKREYYVVYQGDRPVSIAPVLDHNGKKRNPPKWPFGETHTEIMPLSEAPVKAFRSMFERGCFELLERLPLDSVMTTEPENMTGEDMLNDLAKYIMDILKNEIDAPDVQPYPMAFTDTLFYSYDYGDGWEIKITVMDDCKDLVEQGRITQEQLDKAQIKCRELYRPVTIAVDGEMLMDDVGGVRGFVEFLKTIYPDLIGMSAEEKEAAKAEKKDMLDWAKSVQSWKKLNPMI